jgi:hypothetical protein
MDSAKSCRRPYYIEGGTVEVRLYVCRGVVYSIGPFEHSV